MSRWTARRIAGLAYLVPVATLGAIAWMLLCIGGPPADGAWATARELLMDDAQRAIYRWLLALALLCLALAASYLRPAPRLPLVLAQCGAGIALALAAAATLDDSIAVVVALPLVASVPDALWRCMRRRRAVREEGVATR